MKYIYIISMLFINIFITSIVESSTNLYWSVAITNSQYSAAPSMPIMITPTNLIVKYPSEKNNFRVSFDRWDYEINTMGYSPNPNDDIIITTNRITDIWHGRANISYTFTPVSFTNNLVGFKVVYARVEGMELYGSMGEYFEDTWYVALSDTFVEVGERDVEKELDIPIKYPEPEPLKPGDPHYGFDFNW